MHCWVFTPSSFIHRMHDLVELDLVDFAVAGFVPTERDDNEFFVSLERLPKGGDRDAIRRRQFASLAEAQRVLDTWPHREPAEPRANRWS